MNAKHALFPGTFDPITLGHLDLIQRARSVFERVTVLVAAHASKSHLFGAQERVELVRASLHDFAGGEWQGVEVRTTDGLLVDACREHEALTVVRGVRGSVDLEYETQMANTNRAMLPEMDTVFLSAAPEFSHLSSTLVRQISSMRGDVSSFVSAPVLAALHERHSS